jgi:hypothetical protein
MIHEFGFCPIHRLSFNADDPNQVELFEEEAVNL